MLQRNVNKLKTPNLICNASLEHLVARNYCVFRGKAMSLSRFYHHAIEFFHSYQDSHAFTTQMQQSLLPTTWQRPPLVKY